MLAAKCGTREKKVLEKQILIPSVCNRLTATMPIPPQKKEEIKEPELGSWQSMVYLGLVATAATGMMVARGGFKMNRNWNVMQRFWTSHSDKIGNMVEYTPPGKDTIFRKNVTSIVETAEKIATNKIPDKTDARHSYPKPTFATHSYDPNKRTLYSSKGKAESDANK